MTGHDLGAENPANVRSRLRTRHRMEGMLLCLAASGGAAWAHGDCVPGWQPFIAGGEAGVSSNVWAATTWNGDLVAGGPFDEAAGQVVNGMARWDGAAWHAFASGGETGVGAGRDEWDSVYAVTVWNDNVVAGGQFTTAGGQTVNGIARWDGAAWHPFVAGGQTGVSGSVRALAVWNGDLIAGGFFTTAGGQTVNRIARWDGAAWHPFTSGGSTGVGGGAVVALTVWNGDLIAGGRFTTAGGQTVNGIARWDGAAWHPFTSGGQTGVAGSEEAVGALAVWNADLIAGGWFTTAGGQTVNHIARWGGSAWHSLASGGEIGVGGVLEDPYVVELSVWNGDLIAGGSFDTAGGQTVNHIARWDGSAWHAFASGGQVGATGSVSALAVWNSDLVAGAYFAAAPGYIARWGCPAGSPVALTGEVLMLLIRADDFDHPDHEFAFEVDITVSGGAAGASITLPGGTFIPLEDDRETAGSWSLDLLFDSVRDFHQLTQGTWTITLSDVGGHVHVSTFDLDAGEILDADLFATPTVLSPQHGEVRVSPCPTFTWLDPTGEADADVLGVSVETRDEAFEQEAVSLFGDIPLDATSWTPPLPLQPGSNSLSVYYLAFDDAGRVGPLDVVSGAITWGDSKYAPPGYPRSTPLLLIGSETRISFSVSGTCAGIPGDLDGDRIVGFADLLILLSNWGPCRTCDVCLSDIDGDCSVGFSDLLLLLSHWS